MIVKLLQDLSKHFGAILVLVTLLAGLFYCNDDNATNSQGDPNSKTSTTADIMDFESVDTEQTLDMEIKGVNRTYYLYIPPSTKELMSTDAVPLIIGLHGADGHGGGSGSSFCSGTGIKDQAEEYGWIAACPDAYNGLWWTLQAEGWSGSDITPTSLLNDHFFIQALILEIYDTYRLDINRIYLCGFSRGNLPIYTEILATNNPDSEDNFPNVNPIAAYAVNSGQYESFLQQIFSPFHPNKVEPKRPVWIIHGSQDSALDKSNAQLFNDDLEDWGFEPKLDIIQGADHTWLFDTAELFDFFLDNAMEE